MNKNDKIYIAGHDGMVGTAIKRNLESKGYVNIVTRDFPGLDLTNQISVEQFFENEKPEIVIDAAAKVGGILANDMYRAQFIYENIQIQNNLIHSSHNNNVKKLLFLGSSCIYPKYAEQPMKEDYLLTGKLEYTNEPYAIAKICGIKMCENYYKQYGDNFISVMPTNLYGFNDNFDLKTSHVMPALIRKFHEARLNGSDEVVIWGTGKPKREFLFVDDMADACVHILESISAKKLYVEKGLSHINIGTGMDCSISELADIIKDVVGYEGSIVYDTSKPDGTPRKLLDVSLLSSLGWSYKTQLTDGIIKTYNWFKDKSE